MTCVEEFLEIVDLSASKWEFPSWDYGEDYIYFGAMRVSGFTADAGVALVFERSEYSVPEHVVQSAGTCLATFPVPVHLIVGNGIFIEYSNVEVALTDNKTSGKILASSRGRSFEIDLNKTSLIQGGYLEPDEDMPKPHSILFKICDTVPGDWLYSDPEYLITEFEMGQNAIRLFHLEEWQHLSLDEVYGSHIKPSSSPDIVALVEAVCNGSDSPQLMGTPNTSWRIQWPSHD
jgi:hypothetical protein